MYPGGHAGAHRHFPSTHQTRARGAGVFVHPCRSRQRQQLGTAGSRNLQDVQGRILALARSRCWNVQYRLQKLTSSTVLIWLRVFILCPMSLLQCALLSRAQAPLLNPLLVFYSVCLLWVLLPGTCQHGSGGTHPRFSPGAQLAPWWIRIWVCSAPALVARLLLAASSGSICDPWCQDPVWKTIRKTKNQKLISF